MEAEGGRQTSSRLNVLGSRTPPHPNMQGQMDDPAEKEETWSPSVLVS